MYIYIYHMCIHIMYMRYTYNIRSPCVSRIFVRRRSALYVCVYIHIYIIIYIYIYTRVHMYTSIHTYVYTYMYMYVYIYI